MCMLAICEVITFFHRKEKSHAMWACIRRFPLNCVYHQHEQLHGQQHRVEYAGGSGDQTQKKFYITRLEDCRVFYWKLWVISHPSQTSNYQYCFWQCYNIFKSRVLTISWYFGINLNYLSSELVLLPSRIKLI